MKFLGRAMQNPNFLQQLVQQREWRKELEEAFSNKRRRPICDAEECSDLVKLEQEEYDDEMSELEVSDIELAMNMEEQSGEEEKGGEAESRNEGIEEVLWEELLNEGVEEDLLALEDDDDNEDVTLLSEELGYLASKS